MNSCVINASFVTLLLMRRCLFIIFPIYFHMLYLNHVELSYWHGVTVLTIIIQNLHHLGMFVQYVPVLRICNFPYIFYVELWELEGVVGCCNNYFDKSVGAVRSLLHVLGFSVCNLTPFGIIVLEKTYIFSSFSFNISQSHNWL